MPLVSIDGALDGPRRARRAGVDRIGLRARWPGAVFRNSARRDSEGDRARALRGGTAGMCGAALWNFRRPVHVGGAARGRRLGALLPDGQFVEVRVNHGLAVDSDEGGVGADESLVEQSTREGVEAVLLESLEIADVDLRGLGDLAQGDLAQFALTLESLAEARHRHRARRVTTRWARKTFDRGLIIRTGCGFVKPADRKSTRLNSSH